MFLFNFNNEVKKTHYEVLGVPTTAAKEEIKRAYFNLVRKYQPDRSPEEFKEIRAAYETLSDKKKRGDYDAINDLPPSVVSFFHEAQRFERLGRQDKALELYRIILKRYPKLDNVREQYAHTLYADDKYGKAIEEWEELCRRHPDNPQYARDLGLCYTNRGWNKKALAELRRAVALDRSSLDGWNLLISSVIENLKSVDNAWNELNTVVNEALEAVKEVKLDEWKKIYIYSHAFLVAGNKELDRARGYSREIVRLIREGGRDAWEEGRYALKKILLTIPSDSLSPFYPELKEMANLLPDIPALIRMQLDAIRLDFEIENLAGKKFSEIFCDLFRILNADDEDEEDELDVTAIEYNLLDDKKTYEPQIRRLKAEFPELYALHGSFFNEFLRVRDPEKMLYQRSKKYKKLKRQIGFDEEEPDSAPETVRRSQPKVGRNDPCPCGSGKKYKHCCGA